MTKTAMTPNGWNRYQKVVLYRLQELTDKVDTMQVQVSKLSTAVALLKWKVGTISATIGALVGAGAAFFGGKW